jgi:hypothetical protein
MLPAHGVDLAGNGWPPGIRVIVCRECGIAARWARSAAESDSTPRQSRMATPRPDPVLREGAG